MKKHIYLFVTATILLASCGGGQQENGNGADTVATDMENGDQNGMEGQTVAETSEIKVTPVTDSPEFPDAKLILESPKANEINEAGKVPFKFKVESAEYQLGNQTADAETKDCANSAKGQHIHYIRNNNPYVAFYEPTFEEELKPGNNVVLAFLSRSYHESIKTPEANVLVNFYLPGSDEEEIILQGEHMFYSRPKGTYVGPGETEKLLLDFYLVNTELAADGNKVKAIINGEEFMLDKWQPYYIEGLPIGENTVQLQLVDKDGNVVPGPFNDSGIRKITLEEAPGAGV